MSRHAKSPRRAAVDSSLPPRGGHRRRRRSGVPRTVLAVTATALAAGLGAVLSGVLPMPPGMPRSVVVAGDPASSQAALSGVAPSGRTHRAGSGGRAPAGTGTGSATPTGTATASTAPSSPTTASAPTSATSAPSATVTAQSTPDGPPPSPDAVASAQQQILSLVNAQRAQAGCPALTDSGPLTDLAESFSTEMATRGFFSHTDPDHKSPWDRAKSHGIHNLGGENIARGQQSPTDVMTAWMHSPGHRANILDCQYHSLGVGVYFGPGGPWWTQDFGF